jgi:hypothetical protein
MSIDKPSSLANEKLYLVEMRNESDICLNDLFENVIVKEKRPKSANRLDEILEKKKSPLTPPPPPPPPPAPPKRPVLKPLDLGDIPQQKGLAHLNKNKNEQYVVFSRSIELFYVFSTNVELIQSSVQQVTYDNINFRSFSSMISLKISSLKFILIFLFYSFLIEVIYYLL